MLFTLCRTTRCLPRFLNISMNREINTFKLKVIPLCRTFKTTKTSSLILPLKIGLIQNIRENSQSSDISELSSVTFEKVCDDTLESLCDYFGDLVENSGHLRSADVTLGDGVLTIQFGEPYGTYVINRQSPNKQIWLSSPKTGPKRYDYVQKGSGYWVYKHDGVTLHDLLQQEIEPIIKQKVHFNLCSHGSE